MIAMSDVLIDKNAEIQYDINEFSAIAGME